MQDMDGILVNCPELCLPDDLSEYLDDNNLDKIVDPEILLSDCLLSGETDAENNSGVPGLTDSSHEESGTDTITRPCTRQRPTAAGVPGCSPVEVLSSPAQPSSQPLPPSARCIITVRKSEETQTVWTMKLPPIIRPPHTSAILLLPVTPRCEVHIPPLSPVAPVQINSAPSGSQSGVPPICSSPQSDEMCPIKESCPCLAQNISQIVKDYIRETKAYMSQACDNLQDGLTLTSNFVETKVLQRDNVRKGKKRNRNLDKGLDVLGETEMKRHTVSLEQIFDQHQRSGSKSFHLLLGNAGMGKSTCIKKLCLAWSKGCIPRFDFVFLLDGRLLSITEPAHSLQSLLLSLSSLAPRCLDPESVLAQIVAFPKRVLLIFDGFDELQDFELLVQPSEKNAASWFGKDQTSNRLTVRQLYSAILLQVLLPGCCLLLASRPRGSASLLLRKVDNILEISGFSPSEVQTYMQCYFSDPDVQKSAMNCLEKCEYLRLLCWNPGICQLVCRTLQRQRNVDALPRTLTEVCNSVLGMKFESVCIIEEEMQFDKPVEEEDICSSTQTRSKTQVRTRRKAPEKNSQKRRDTDLEESGVLHELCGLAWVTVKSSSSKIPSECPVSSKSKAVGLRAGLFDVRLVGRRRSLSSPENNKVEMEKKDTTEDTKGDTPPQSEGHEILSWANPFLQSFLAAVHLSLSSAALMKTLPFQTGGKRRLWSQREDFELTLRFAVGLLFQNHSDFHWLRPTNKRDPSSTKVKQNNLMDHLRHLLFDHRRPSHILDLCRFIHEGSFAQHECSKDSSFSQLAGHLVDNLPQTLTFKSLQLNPADVYALKNIIDFNGKKERTFSLEVQDLGMQVCALRSLVGLDAVSSYRGCLADVIDLWEKLEKQKEDRLLSNAVSKFKMGPFKAVQVNQIEHLAKLMDIHVNKRLSGSQSGSILAEGVPAIKDLHKFELELGPEKGPLALPLLWEILPGLHNLQHMDLENNNITDDGAQHLSSALASLLFLETLNLSLNSIGDDGAKALAVPLRNLPKLDRLSLHSNVIADEGVCSLAAVLPDMAALRELDVRYNKLTDVGAVRLGSSLQQCKNLKSLRMWSQCIPYGVFEKLQQQDHRITVSF